MTQNEKDLLLKDLCARLPFGIKVQYENEIFDVEYVCPMYEEVKLDNYETWTLNIEEVKPYLLPLSSMTERQCYELSSIRSTFQDCWKYIKTPIPLSICNFEQIEWFHKNHLDYRGLIEKGLAIDATDKNIY